MSDARSDDDPGDDPALAKRLADARPDADALARSVWFARVASALFGDASQVTVGRYQLQRQLGRGGGGSVFVASDPELHRDVAVKLIRCASDRHRERALAEARALAKLSHPNVVPVHDVGETATHVYLVMELLRGASLREHADGRSPRELVAAYRQAASGLAAAHAAGLVHRDFKPDNAMFGDDGRLRVVDFGLAAEHAGPEDGPPETRSTADPPPAGTPRYMAPEQRAGARADAAVDQYALGVSLAEAIGEPPAWLARVIARATADQPAARYPSMAALAEALGDDPRHRWRRRALIAAPLVLAAIGFGIGRGATSNDAAACGGGRESLAPAWTPELVDEVVAHVRSLRTPFAVAAAPVVRDRLAGRGESWLAAHRRSCLAHDRGELSDELYDRATVCLAHSRIGLREAIQLLSAAPAEQLHTAIGALAVVERAERCAEPAVLAAAANPQPTPAMRVIDQQLEMTALHVHAETGRAVPFAERAVAAARANGDPRLQARALLLLGHAFMSADLERALPPLREAIRLGILGGDDGVVVEAFARRSYVLGQGTRETRAHAFDGLDLVTAIGSRIREGGVFPNCLLANNLGAAAMLAGNLHDARAYFREAVKGLPVIRDAEQSELVVAVSNLALVTPEASERRRLYDLAIAQVSGAVGPDHPSTLAHRLRATADLADPRAVVSGLLELCHRVAELHPARTDLVDDYAYDIAWQATAIGMTDQVREAGALVRSRTGPPTFQRRVIAAYGALATEPATRPLIDRLTELVNDTTPTIKDGWWQNLPAADTELALAAAARALGDRTLTRSAAADAIRHLDAYLAVAVSNYTIERRLAWARELRGP